MEDESLAARVTITAMKKFLVAPILGVCCLAGCNKPGGPVASSGSGPSSPPDAMQQKLQEYSGASATNCGRLNVQATPDQSKTASDCALQASQGKHPFYVAYDMPGMSVGVAGNSEGKLYNVQTQGSPSPSVTAGACPSQLRVASSGRVTCLAPGDMGAMSGTHPAGAVPSGMANPHGSPAKPPSN